MESDLTANGASLTDSERITILRQRATKRAETRRNLEDDFSWLLNDFGGDEW